MTIWLVWTGLGEAFYQRPKVEQAFTTKQAAEQWISDNNITYGFGLQEIELKGAE